MTAMCDWVWQDDKDGYRIWQCNEHGEIESEELEEKTYGED